MCQCKAYYTPEFDRNLSSPQRHDQLGMGGENIMNPSMQNRSNRPQSVPMSTSCGQQKSKLTDVTKWNVKFADKNSPIPASEFIATVKEKAAVRGMS